jgi:hypothetical protein
MFRATIHGDKLNSGNWLTITKCLCEHYQELPDQPCKFFLFMCRSESAGQT